MTRNLGCCAVILALVSTGPLAAQIVVTPDNAALQAPANTSGQSAPFWLRWNGSGNKTLYLFCYPSPNVSSCSPSQTVITIPAGINIPVSATFASGAAGNGVISFKACDGPGCFGGQDYGSYNVTITAPPPPPQVALPYSANTTGAMDGVSYVYATPAIGSMGTPQSLSLVYNSTAARPVSLVYLDVTGPTSPAPTTYQLQVQRVSNGVNLTLMNGATSVYYMATPGVVDRLTAAIDGKNNGLTTGSYPVRLLLTTYYPSATRVDTIATRILVNDQTASPFGAGVGIAGVGKLYTMTGSYGRLLVDGSGAMVFFDRSCPTCAFISPAGQSGTLVALGSDTAFQLTALDGSFAIFRSDGYLVRQNVLPTVLARRLVWTASPILLDSVVDTTGRGFKLTYSSGLLTQITDFANRSTGATIASGKLVKVTYADGAVDSLTYNANNLLMQLNSRTGGVWNYGYNALLQGDTVRAPSATDYTGASVRPTTTVITAAEVQWQSGIAGTSLGAPKGSIRPDTIYQSSTDPVGNVTKSQSDRFGLPTKLIDALGQTTTITRDTLGNATIVREPTGRVRTGTYVGYFLTAAYDSSTGQLVKYTYGLSTANQGGSYGWIDPDGGGGGEVGNALSLNAIDDKTVAAANRVYNTLGDPTAGANLPAPDGKYTIQFKLIASTPTVTPGNNSTITAILNTEYSINSGASWTSVGGPSNVTASRSTPGITTTTEVFTPTLTFSGGGPVWIRLILRGTASGTLSGGYVKVLVFANGTTEPYPVTWFRAGGSASPRLLAVEGGPSRIDYSYHDGTVGPKGALMLEYVGNTLTPGSVPQGGALVAKHYPNAYGQDTLVVDGLDHKTRSVYATLASGGNLSKTVNAVGDSTKVHYDSYGLPDTTTLPNGVKEGLTRDVLNRTTQARNGLGYVTQYTYSTIGLSRVTDPKSQVYKFGLNSWGLMVLQHDLGDTTKVDSVKYDAAGRVRTVIRRRGDAITMTYDQLGRLKTRTGPDFPAESLSYGLLSAGGSWLVASSANGRDSVAFNKAGQLVYARQQLPGDATTYAMSYAYDTTGHLINRTALPNGTVARWVYRKNLGVLDTLCGAGACTSFTRDAELKTLQIEHPGGAVPWLETFFYDSLHRVTLHDMQGGTAGLESSYGYDVLSRVIHSASTPKDTFWYDAAGQLINACNRPSSSPCTNEYNQADVAAYAYDSAGNRIDSTAHSVIAAGNRVTQFKGYAITYDANGNIIKKAGLGTVGIWTRTDTTTFEWNAIGQLVKVETWPASGSHTVVTFRYDAWGRRISKRVNTTTTRFLYDRDRVVMDLDSATGVMKAEYGYSDGGALYAIRTATDTMIVINTPTIGTVLGTQRARGGLILKDFPDRAGNGPPFPWGQEPPDTGFIVRYRMAGQEYDQEIGIYHMGARYYDPILGRWLSEDPIGIEGGLNLYAYVGNDPVNRRDPSGLGGCAWVSVNTFNCYAYESDCPGGSLQSCVSGMAMAFCASIGGRWVDGTRTCVMPGRSGGGSRGGGVGGPGQQNQGTQPTRRSLLEKMACRVLSRSFGPTTVSLGVALDVVPVLGAVMGWGGFIGGEGFGSYSKRSGGVVSGEDDWTVIGADVGPSIEGALTIGSFGGVALDGQLGAGVISAGLATTPSSWALGGALGPNAFPVSGRVGLVNQVPNYLLDCR